jgi:hypothetical protein
MGHPWGMTARVLAGLAGTAAALLLCGCATMNKNECRHADWKTIGFEDGARGYTGTRIGRHRKACAGYGVAPDVDLYESGRRQGLLEWCRPHTGYRLGIQGKHYNGVCPGDLEADFLAALEQGRAVHAYGTQVKKQEDRLKQTIAQMAAMDEDLHAKEAALISNDASPRRRMTLLQEIRRLEAEQRDLKADIDDMALTLNDMRKNLDRMRKNNPYQ